MWTAITWDADKDEANVRKHGVSFEEASGVLLDPRARLDLDVAHSYHELRLRLVGQSRRGRLLMVVIAPSDEGSARIISAWRLHGVNELTSKTTRADTDVVDAWRGRLTGPFEIRIDGATAYWLEDVEGRILSEESDRTTALCADVLRQVAAGISPRDVIVWSRLADGCRYQVASGDTLLALADTAAGSA